jgi:hypothetical protein
MAGRQVKILYIAGAGRSGSTILEMLLGQVPGFLSVGEVHHVWDRGLLENWRCGCGEDFRSCPTWRAVFDSAFGGFAGVDPGQMRQIQQIVIPPRLPGVLPRSLALLGRRRRERPPLKAYADTLARLYAAIQEVTGCRVIVDSSKYPTYGYLLSTIPSVDLYVVHLRRDPRAVAYSWMRPKPNPGQDTPLPTAGPVPAGAAWTLWEVAGHLLWRQARRAGRCLPLRYEDFVADPPGSLRRVLAFVQEEGASLPSVSEREALVAPTSHAFSGNPVRFQQGRVEIRADAAWRAQMAARDRAIVTLLTWPLLLAYHYPLIPGRPQADDHHAQP